MVKFIENALLVTFCIGMLTFVLSYFFRSLWRKNIVGRYVLYFMATITGVFIYILFSPLIREFSGRNILNIGILLILNYSAWKITWLLIRIQRNGNKEIK